MNFNSFQLPNLSSERSSCLQMYVFWPSIYQLIPLQSIDIQPDCQSKVHTIRIIQFRRIIIEDMKKTRWWTIIINNCLLAVDLQVWHLTYFQWNFIHFCHIHLLIATKSQTSWNVHFKYEERGKENKNNINKCQFNERRNHFLDTSLTFMVTDGIVAFLLTNLTN